MTSSCPSELTLSMHADRALSAADAVATELHLAACANCRGRLAELRSEASIVAAALAHDTEPATVPAYRRPVSRLAMAATAIGGTFAAVLAAVASDLIGGLLQGPVSWFNPFDAGTVADLGVEAAIFLAKHAGAIMTAIAKTALMALFTTLIGWFAFARRRRGPGPLLLAALFGIVLLQPLPSHALEIRHDEKEVFIPAGETIDDTLIVAGEVVEVAGDVTGDLVAVGRRVVVRGRVGGQVFAAAKTVTIDGEVGGSVLALATETVAVASPRIGRNLYGAAATIDLRPAARVDANALVAGEHVQLAGSVGRDALAAGEDVDVSGNVGGALTAYAEHIALLAAAHIAGNVTAYIEHADDLTVSQNAVIGGKLTTELVEAHAERNKYLTGEFYLFQLMRFAAAFVSGAVLLALVPGLRSVTVDGARPALIAGGVGLVTIIAAPIIAVLVAMTIVGLPLGVFALLLWGVGVYLAKVIVAHFVGARLVEADNPRHFTIALAAGLALMIVLINLPVIGGVLNFVFTILGLGCLALFLKRVYDGEADNGSGRQSPGIG